MSQKDYYKILGVDEKAGFDVIKKAYRKLAKENHPDAHPGDKQAEERFKEISEAYNVLSDTKKRQQYDQFRKYGFGSSRGTGGFHQPGFDFDFSDFFNGAGQHGRKSKYKSNDFNLDDIFGLGGLGDLFSQIFDKQSRVKHNFYNNKEKNDIYATLEIPFETAIKGGKTIFKVPEKGDKQFSLNISPGTEDGKKLRLSGHGNSGSNGVSPGDLIVTIKVAKHRFFEIDGLDIICEIPLDIKKAKKGTIVRVKTVYGGSVELKIPPNTTQNKTFRLKGLGIKTKDALGDQFVKIKLK